MTPLINKICKPCNCVTHLVVFSLKYFLPGNYHSKLTLSDRIQGAKKVSLIACQLWASCRLHVLAQKPFQLAKKIKFFLISRIDCSSSVNGISQKTSLSYQASYSTAHKKVDSLHSILAQMLRVSRSKVSM